MSLVWADIECARYKLCPLMDTASVGNNPLGYKPCQSRGNDRREAREEVDHGEHGRISFGRSPVDEERSPLHLVQVNYCPQLHYLPAQTMPTCSATATVAIVELGACWDFATVELCGFSNSMLTHEPRSGSDTHPSRGPRC